MNRKDSKIAVQKLFKSPTAFAKIPKKPKIFERMATMNDVKAQIEAS